MTTPSGLFDYMVEVFSGFPFFSIWDDESYFITLISGNYGSNVKIFESQTDLYVYRLGGLLKWDNDVEFEYAGGDCATISQTDEGVFFSTINDSYTRNSTGRSGVLVSGYVSWGYETTFSGCVARAGLSTDTYFDTIPNFIGNSYISALKARIFRNTNQEQPIGDFVKSDTGLPYAVPLDCSQITDLEAL